VAHRRQLDVPVLASDVGQAQVGVKAEGHRDGVVAGGGQRRAHRERAPAQGDVELDAMREGEGLEQLGVGGEVQLRRQRPGPAAVAVAVAIANALAQRPMRRAAKQPVDRQPALVARDQARVRWQAHRGPVDAVLVGRQAVGPRVQQRNAHRRGAAGVAVHAGPPAEQLPPAVAQRGADHPRGGNEGGIQVRGGRAQADRLVALYGGGLDQRHGRSLAANAGYAAGAL
jgi:hypothetical protein